VPLVEGDDHPSQAIGFSWMLTRLVIRRFKRFVEADIELGNPVVFVGPNDAGKTSALQALLLWQIGLRRYLEKRGPSSVPDTRAGIAINRKDLTGIPVATARALWHDLYVLHNWTDEGKKRADKVRVDVIVEGISAGRGWVCGLEFDYANEESIYVRPLRGENGDERMLIPELAADASVALLAPMSGLAANETRLPPGAIDVRIGEGRTAEVLRNLCFQVLERDEADGETRFAEISGRIARLFGAHLDSPREIAERGEISMSYRTSANIRLDLASAGRGLQQTLLLLAFLTLNRGAVVLLDEPDAHLEILRQRQTYAMLSEMANETGGQVIAASHSEVILNEAARRDTVIAFLGRPHRIDDRGKSQLAKALTDIGFEAYYAAEERGWILFLEGSTDLAILHALARCLDHPAIEPLDGPFVDYVFDRPQLARNRFHGLREGVPNLVGVALFDRLDHIPEGGAALSMHMWSRREIENYICQPATLLSWARQTGGERSLGGLFEVAEADRWESAMTEQLQRLVPPVALDSPDDPYWRETKISEQLLDRLFEAFFAELGIENLIRKSNYHVLADHVRPADIDPEVTEVLDKIAATADAATPSQLPDAHTPSQDV
jgi:ABC-type arginine transport system ATPase subunit